MRFSAILEKNDFQKMYARHMDRDAKVFQIKMFFIAIDYKIYVSKGKILNFNHFFIRFFFQPSPLLIQENVSSRKFSFSSFN